MPRDYTGKNIDELLAGDFKEAVAAIKADPSVEAAIGKYKAENEEYGFLVDDVFVLRYAISHHGDVPSAVKAVVSTLEWRHQNQSVLRPFHKIEDAVIKKDVQRDWEELTRHPGTLRLWSQHVPGFNEFMAHGAASYHGRSVDGGPVFYARPGLSTAKEAENSVPPQVMKNIIVFAKEPGYKLCDFLTRRDRTLVHCTTIVDATGIGLSSLPSSTFRKIQSEATVETELYYPLFSGPVILVNLPLVLRVFLAGFLMILPSSVSSKVVVSNSPKSAKDRPDPQQLFHGIPLASLPSFLGGLCRCGSPRVSQLTGTPMFSSHRFDSAGNDAGWCIDGVPNTLDKPFSVKQPDGG